MTAANGLACVRMGSPQPKRIPQFMQALQALDSPHTRLGKHVGTWQGGERRGRMQQIFVACGTELSADIRGRPSALLNLLAGLSAPPLAPPPVPLPALCAP